MQETFDSKSVSPPGMKDDERREILAHLEKIMPQHTGKPAGANDSFSLKDLEDLAKWERFVVLRRDAPLRRKWYADLHSRTTSMMMGTDSERKLVRPVSEHDPKLTCHSKLLKQPLIRSNTFKLLVRPAEVDFDPIRFVLIFTSICSFAYAGYTQIVSIEKLCSGPFLCPSAAAGWKHRPVLAPPVALRKASGLKRTSSLYYRDLEPVCEFNAPACLKPGYKIEWPYLQTSNSTEEFPEELKSMCGGKPIVSGTDGYVFDYTSSTLRTEYWQCKGKTCPSWRPGSRSTLIRSGTR